MSDQNQESSTKETPIPDEDKPKVRPGPKPKVKMDLEKELMQLKDHSKRLEKLVLELVLHSGYNALARKNGFTPLVANPQKKYQS